MRAARIAAALLIPLIMSLMFGCKKEDVPASKEANMANQQDAIEKVRAVLSDMQTGWESRDVDRIIAAYSDEYWNSDGTDKSGLHAFFIGLNAQGALKNTVVGLEKCEITLDGDTVDAGPISYDSPTGRSLYQYRFKSEADGVWRIVYNEPVYAGKATAPFKIAGTGDPSATGYSQLDIQGNGHNVDSFSLSVVAAAELLGVKADYDTAYALSTNAFAPALHMEEPAKCWWTAMYGRDWSMDLVAEGLGLSVRAAPPPNPGPPDGLDGDALPTWEFENWRMPVVRWIQQAHRDGESVVVWREWENGPWAWFGLVTQATDDGTVLGASLNGGNQNPLPWLCGLHALRPKDSKPTTVELNTRLLRRVVRRIRQDGPPFDTAGPHTCAPGDGVAFGLRAMDHWIDQMKIVPYCPECKDQPDRVWTCALSSAQPIYEGAKVSARYLRRLVSDFPKRAGSHLETAAANYDRIVELLRPAITGKGGEPYKDLIGDPDKQNNHAINVLAPIKEELAQAADEIEKVLAAL